MITFIKIYAQFNPFLNQLEKKDIYKAFLFEFCFQSKNGSV